MGQLLASCGGPWRSRILACLYVNSISSTPQDLSEHTCCFNFRPVNDVVEIKRVRVDAGICGQERHLAEIEHMRTSSGEIDEYRIIVFVASPIRGFDLLFPNPPLDSYDLFARSGFFLSIPARFPSRRASFRSVAATSVALRYAFDRIPISETRRQIAEGMIPRFPVSSSSGLDRVQCLGM